MMMKQIFMMIWIGLLSLPQRLWLSLATVITIAVVVAVLLAFLSMSQGFRQTLGSSGSEDVAIILRGGSGAELNSVLSREQLALIETAPGLLERDGASLVSGELYVVVDGTKKSSGTKANLPLRGVAIRAPAITAGRMFIPGRNELIVGEALLREFNGFEPGSMLRFGATQWTVVGVFSTGGVFDSEIWSDLGGVQNQFNRGSSVQSVRAKLINPQAIEILRSFADQDPRLTVDIISERRYYAEQSERTSDLILVLGWPLSIAMSLGALAGALNTIYLSVSARSRDIATVRAIGFSGFSAFCGTLAESLFLSAVGGLLGALVALVFFDGLSASTLGGNFTQVVFNFSLSSDLFIQGLWLALLIGLIGGFFPAIRAARLPVAQAFGSR
jgi:putative ABC transport system permease protein